MDNLWIIYGYGWWYDFYPSEKWLDGMVIQLPSAKWHGNQTTIYLHIYMVQQMPSIWVSSPDLLLTATFLSASIGQLEVQAPPTQGAPNACRSKACEAKVDLSTVVLWRDYYQR